MPRTKKQVIELTQEELDHLLRDAAHEGAREATEKLRDKVADLDRAARVEAGLITLQDICAMYDVSADPVRNWGVEPIEYPGRKNLYRVEDLPAQITDSDPE